MPWFKVDDSFHSHPKVLATSPAALGLWVVAGAWSSANLTEGFVPDHALPRLIPDSEPLARELVSVGLWRRERGGYRFHDWIAYNPTRSEATAARDRMASGGAIGNHRRWHTARGVVDPKCAYCQQKQDRGSDRVPDREPDSGPNPPTRPDPSLSGTTTGSTSRSVGGAGGTPRDRGSRLPEGWQPDAELIEWARQKAPSCGPEDHAAFVDYWRSVPGAKGRKVDWRATWRNWMRTEHQKRSRHQPSTNGHQPQMGTTERKIRAALEAGRQAQTLYDQQQQRMEIAS